MEKNYRSWRCQLDNTFDAETGCTCGMSCDLPSPTRDELERIQEDQGAFYRWWHDECERIDKGVRERERVASRDAVAEVRMQIYRELRDSVTDEQARVILNGDRPTEEMTERRAHDYLMDKRIGGKYRKIDNPLSADEFMDLISWGRDRLGDGAMAFEKANDEWGVYRCPVCARYDNPDCASDC